MPTFTAVADGSNEVERNAASDAVAVQDAVNLVAIVNSWQRHLTAMHRAEIRKWTGSHSGPHIR